MANAKEKNKELSKGCAMYEPCPICFKCMNKASHLYLRCQNCEVQFCGHSHKQRSFMIRRENFAINVTNQVGEELLNASKRIQYQEEQINEKKETEN